MKSYRVSVCEKMWSCLLYILLAGVVLGCQSKVKQLGPLETKASPPRVTLEAGDVVEIKFFYTPELNETQTVRPDGKIALQLIGEVEVEGKTPADVRTELLDKYAHSLKDPEIAVIVRSLFNRRVFVGGQVMTPGIVEMPGKLTVLEAIMQAGGFDMQEAEVRNVVVIRHRDRQRYGYSVNLEPALSNTGDGTEPFYLEPQDIVYVPQTEIAKVGQWVDQHINQLIPRTGFFYSRSIGKSTIGIDTSSRY